MKNMARKDIARNLRKQFEKASRLQAGPNDVVPL